MKNGNLKTEQGRSMVEMLGVLAIMGLLTIIGIAGFKIAMNKAKANSLVADMNRLAHIVVMDKFSGYSEEAIQNAVTEHNQSTEYQAIYKTLKPGIFTLEATGIDKDLCQQVAGLDWQVPLATFVDGAEKDNFVAEDCGDSNTLTWAFTDDLSPCPDCVLGEVNCEEYGNNGQLECGSCTPLKGFVADARCANNENGSYCVRGYCSPCAEGSWRYTSGNTCVACNIDYAGTWNTVATTEQNCLKKMFACHNTKTGGVSIQGCNDDNTCTSSGIVADETSCKECPNRCYLNGRCYFAGEGQAYQRVSNEDGTCQQ